MRIIRFLDDKHQIHFGQQVDDHTALRIDGDIAGQWHPTQEKLKVRKLLAPIVPTDILCIGLNYLQHARESGSTPPKTPMLFIKARSSLAHPLDPIYVPRLTVEVDYEAELAVVIGRNAKHVTRDRAMDYVLGYTCANDVSARDWQRDKNLGGGQFARGKSFDTFCPLGPAIVTKDEVPNPNQLAIRSILNGKIMQESNTSDMIFDIPALIESLSSTLTLQAGSVILTGTPQGVGFARNPPVFLKAGDRIAVEIDGIGRLENPVAAEA